MNDKEKIDTLIMALGELLDTLDGCADDPFTYVIENFDPQISIAYAFASDLFQSVQQAIEEEQAHGR